MLALAVLSLSLTLERTQDMMTTSHSEPWRVESIEVKVMLIEYIRLDILNIYKIMNYLLR